MPTYFQENRFQRRQRRNERKYEHIRETNDDGAMVPRDPKFRQQMYIDGGGLLEGVQKAALWTLDVIRNNRAGEIHREIASKVPAGREITIEISSSGDWGGREDVDLSMPGQTQPAFRDPHTNYRSPITIKGTGPAGPMPSSIEYTRPDGSKETLPIQGAPPPLPAPKPRPNVIDVEPLGMDFRIGGGERRLGADARGDRGYPGSGHMRA